jgi:hypothetical protein
LVGCSGIRVTQSLCRGDGGGREGEVVEWEGRREGRGWSGGREEGGREGGKEWGRREEEGGGSGKKGGGRTCMMGTCRKNTCTALYLEDCVTSIVIV